MFEYINRQLRCYIKCYAGLEIAKYPDRNTSNCNIYTAFCSIRASFDLINRFVYLTKRARRRFIIDGVSSTARDPRRDRRNLLARRRASRKRTTSVRTERTRDRTLGETVTRVRENRRRDAVEYSVTANERITSGTRCLGLSNKRHHVRRILYRTKSVAAPVVRFHIRI